MYISAICRHKFYGWETYFSGSKYEVVINHLKKKIWVQAVEILYTKGKTLENKSNKD